MNYRLENTKAKSFALCRDKFLVYGKYTDDCIRHICKHPKEDIIEEYYSISCCICGLFAQFHDKNSLWIVEQDDENNILYYLVCSEKCRERYYNVKNSLEIS